MDPESYETITFDESFVADAKDYLTENLKCEILYVEGKAASLQLPSQVTSESHQKVPKACAATVRTTCRSLRSSRPAR